MRIAIGVPTKGRASILEICLKQIERQSRLPDHVFVQATSEDDIGGIDASCFSIPISVGLGPTGLTLQRNVILKCALDFDLLIFLDDDFLVHPDYVGIVEAVFLANPTIVLGTGRVIADGAKGTGLSISNGLSLLSQDVAPFGGIAPTDVAYGCNMIVRMSAKQGLSFIEDFPLYSWYEDVEFSAKMAQRGAIVQILDAAGVHLGSKSGKHSEVRFGYSQVANAKYLLDRHLKSPKWFIRVVGRGLGSNIFHSIFPRSHGDYRGRLRGNTIAFWDWIGGRMHPRRIVDLH